MFSRIVRDILGEDVSSVLASKYGIDASETRELLKKMDFSDYVDLKDAVDNQDTPKVKAILNNMLQTEGNSYTAARQTTDDMQDEMGDEEQIMNIAALDAGDVVTTNGGDSKINDVSNLGSQRTMGTDDGHYISVSDQPMVPQTPMTNKDDAMAEIDRIKKLAGIEDDSMEEKIGSPTPMTCKAMSRDGSTTPNQIIDRHKKKEKPGPKTGSKHGKLR